MIGLIIFLVLLLGLFVWRYHHYKRLYRKYFQAFNDELCDRYSGSEMVVDLIESESEVDNLVKGQPY